MTSDNQALFWTKTLKWTCGSCLILGILLLLATEVGLAKTHKPSTTRKPAQTGPGFNNPFNEDDFEDFDEFDEEFDAAMGTPAATGRPNTAPPPANRPGANTGGISVGGQPEMEPSTTLQRGNRGLELSGPQADKSVKSKNMAPAFKIDAESGDGKEATKEQIVDFNFPEADIMDIAKTLGKLTGKNFILDKEVKGKVTIISNSPVTVSDAWRAFLTTLDMNNYALVPSGEYLRIMKSNEAKGKQVRAYLDDKSPNSDALVTKIFKIKFISAKDLESVVRTYANMQARIFSHEQTNTLIITDTGSNIAKVAKMIEFLDIEGFDAGIETIQIKHASAVELQKLIDQLLPGTQAGFGPRPQPGFNPGMGGGRGGNFTSRRTKEGGIINTIIADERTNTLIVHANNKGVEQVKQLLTRLDRKIEMNAGSDKVHVIYLQFAEAEEMAKTITTLTQNSRTGGGGAAPGGFGPGGFGINPVEQNLFEGQIRVSADKTTNSLVVTASPTDFSTLQRVVNRLDIPRDQVYVEVVIMEMNMSKTNEFAANLLMPKSGIGVAPSDDLLKFLTNPASTRGLVLNFRNGRGIDIPIPGASTPVNIPSIAALIKALQTYSSANVLATPQLMTLDNSEATFESEENIPIPQVNTSGVGGFQTTSVQFQQVPLTIKVKPQLNKISNMIKLDIKAKLTDVSDRAVPQAVQGQAFATLKRNAETSVIVADSDTIVMGGLTRNKTSETVNKVPLLGDIPVLGWLFKSRSAVEEKTNLFLFITPKIIRPYERARAVLDQKLKERDTYIEKNLGGVDANKDARDNIIRNLPDIKEISKYNPKKSFGLKDEEQPKEKERETLTLPAPEPTPESKGDQAKAIPVTEKPQETKKQ